MWNVDRVYMDPCDWAGTEVDPGPSVDGPHLGSVGYHQGAGQVDYVWIVEVEGFRFVFDAMEMPTANDEEKAELRDVMASIRFVTVAA